MTRYGNHDPVEDAVNQDLILSPAFRRVIHAYDTA